MAPEGMAIGGDTVVGAARTAEDDAAAASLRAVVVPRLPVPPLLFVFVPDPFRRRYGSLLS